MQSVPVCGGDAMTQMQTYLGEDAEGMLVVAQMVELEIEVERPFYNTHRHWEVVTHLEAEVPSVVHLEVEVPSVVHVEVEVPSLAHVEMEAAGRNFADPS